MARNLPGRGPALYRQPRLQPRPRPGDRAFIPRPRRVLEGSATNPYFEEDNLPGSIHATQNSAKVAGEGNHKNGYELEEQAMVRRQRTELPPFPQVDPTNPTDEQTRETSQNQMEEQDSP